MITVTAEQVQAAIDAIQPYADIELRTDYSGRNMYGNTCFGVVGYEPELAKFELALAIEMVEADDYMVDKNDVMDNFENILDCRRQDSMGYSPIYYYPSIKVEGELS